MIPCVKKPWSWWFCNSVVMPWFSDFLVVCLNKQSFQFQKVEWMFWHIQGKKTEQNGRQFADGTFENHFLLWKSLNFEYCFLKMCYKWCKVNTVVRQQATIWTNADQDPSKVLIFHHGFMDHIVYVPSQWETTLHCNVVSHWLGTYIQWSLHTWNLAIVTKIRLQFN